MTERIPVNHDFRGPNRWGRALHADTFRDADPRIEKTGPWWRRRRREIPRAQVIVHMSPIPEPGDFLLYVGHDGQDRRMLIAEIDFMGGNPRDMVTLILERPKK